MGPASRHACRYLDAGGASPPSRICGNSAQTDPRLAVVPGSALVAAGTRLEARGVRVACTCGTLIPARDGRSRLAHDQCHHQLGLSARKAKSNECAHRIAAGGSRFPHLGRHLTPRACCRTARGHEGEGLVGLDPVDAVVLLVAAVRGRARGAAACVGHVEQRPVVGARDRMGRQGCDTSGGSSRSRAQGASSRSIHAGSVTCQTASTTRAVRVAAPLRRQRSQGEPAWSARGAAGGARRSSGSATGRPGAEEFVTRRTGPTHVPDRQASRGVYTWHSRGEKRLGCPPLSRTKPDWLSA